MQSNRFRGVIIYIAIIALLVFGLVAILNTLERTQTKPAISYSDILNEFDSFNVSEFTLDLGSGQLTYQLKSEPNVTKSYTVPNVSLFVNDISDYREQYNEKNSGSPLTSRYLTIPFF